MRCGEVELHNCAELLPCADGGMQPLRVPAAVRAGLDPHGAERMADVVNSEIRFVLEGPRAVLRLHGPVGTTEACVFFGDRMLGEPTRLASALAELVIERPWWLERLDPARLGPHAFAPQVCRVLLGRGTLCFHGVAGPVRPPRPDELPALRLLTYGTSITQGSSATLRHLAWPAQLAWRLGAQLVNLGSAASAYCEVAMADHIGAREDWDLAVLCLSTNMSGFALPVFRSRVDRMIARAAADPRRQVACVTLWPKGADLEAHPDHAAAPEAYRAELRAAVAAHGGPNLHLLEGPALLPRWAGLGGDLLHPNDHGHLLIAEHLARALAPLATPPTA